MTNTAKHTPQWYISTCPETGRRFLCEYGVDNTIAELFGTKEQDVTIAVAPELLVAVKRMCFEMLKAGAESAIDPKVWDTMQDAIAKAEGK